MAFIASHRIVTEKTKWAMPEMNIGLYPDVGGSYFLSRMPGNIGRYLALTSRTINTQDVLYTGAADFYMDSSKWEDLKKEIHKKSWDIPSAAHDLTEILENYCEKSFSNAPIAAIEETINSHFGHDPMEEIMESLKSSGEQGDTWAMDTAKLLYTKSPTSLKATLKQLKEGRRKNH